VLSRGGVGYLDVSIVTKDLGEPLKEGATKRRCEIARCGSVVRNASFSGSGVKNIPIVGTSIFNFDINGVLLS
jgi:hypothetical protein